MTDTPLKSGAAKSPQSFLCQTDPSVDNPGPGNVTAGDITTLILLDLRLEAANLCETLTVQLLAVLRNASIKVENSRAYLMQGKLTALYSPKTGQQITPFPKTLAALSELSEQNENCLLQELGKSMDGTPEAKRLRLRQAIGLKDCL